MRNTGQSCIAANRLFVQRPICQRFLDAFVARVQSLKVGEFSEPGVEIDQLPLPLPGYEISRVDVIVHLRRKQA
jgi:acyl-CoA reductase-like NAD-dependent aldehyde dehydrogenase